ncbi:MAG: 2-amino-4-hydroxy-6-hydroxymethyldihydropteridine diphosphokinase [Acidimicrobiia bacterium]
MEFTRADGALGRWRAAVAVLLGWVPLVGDVVGSIGDRNVSLRFRDTSGRVVHHIDFADHYNEAKEALARARERLSLMTVREFESCYGFGTHAFGRRKAYLGIGSNLGERLANLQSAVDGLAAMDDIDVVAVSPVYATDPVGGPEQGEYLNAVVAIETDLDPRELLGVANDLEAGAERVRGERWGPRTLDVDVLLVGDDELHEPDLEVPHPRMWERGFVMVPLADLDPQIGAMVEPEGGWPGVRPTDLSLKLP